MNSDRVTELEGLIRYHSDLYYNKSAPEITDAEFDALVVELRTLDPENPVLQEVGSTASYGRKVKHSSLMGSLDKETTVAGVTAWHGKYSKEEPRIVLTPKIDGVAVRLNYRDGNLIEAASRGDGVEGQDVTDNVRAMASIPKYLPGLRGMEVEVRGEIYMKRSSFETLQSSGAAGKILANPRNAASGSLMAKDPKVTGERMLDILVYDAIIHKASLKPNFKTEREKRAWMTVNMQELTLVDMSTASIGEFGTLAVSWEAKRSGLDYEIDGLVVALDSLADQEEAGWNGKCPRGKVAFKFKPEQKTARVVGIDWQVGRTGRLTPMCRIEPTLVAGSTISNITLHNAARLKELNLMVGDEVLIEKAGDIIPQVVRVTDRPVQGVGVARGENLFVDKCPSCGGETEMDERLISLWCLNPACPAKLEERMLHYIKTLDILGVGAGIVSGLCKAGFVKDIPDLYYLTIDKIKVVTGGDRAAEKVLTAVLGKNEIPLAVFLDSLGIHGLGTSTSKDIAKNFLTLSAIRGKCAMDLVNIEGIGRKTADSIVKGLRDMAGTIDRLVECIEVQDVVQTSGNLSGLSFCLTGAMSKPRKEIEAAIEAAGGEVRSSVGRGLTYLVQADASSTSSKSEKAKKLGTKILGEAELWSMMGA